MNDLPADALARLNRELAGERIHWAGRPAAALAFWKASPLLLFAVPWSAFAFTWEAIALSAVLFAGDKVPDGAAGLMAWIFPIFGLPFVLVGIGMMAAPFWVAWKTRRIVHVVTDRRLVTAVLGSSMTVESFDPATIVKVSRTERRDGSGTMTFSFGHHLDSDGDRVERTESWIGVPDVKSLEDRVRALMARKAGAG